MCQTSFAANSDLFKSCNVALAEKLLVQNGLLGETAPSTACAHYRLIERPNASTDPELKAELLEPVAKLKESIQVGAIAHFRAASKLETFFGYCHPPLAYGDRFTLSPVRLGRLAALVGIHSQVVSAEPTKYQSMLLKVAQQLATMGMEDVRAESFSQASMLDQPFLFDARLSLKQYLNQIDPELRLSRWFMMKLESPCAPTYVTFESGP